MSQKTMIGQMDGKVDIGEFSLLEYNSLMISFAWCLFLGVVLFIGWDLEMVSFHMPPEKELTQPNHLELPVINPVPPADLIPRPVFLETKMKALNQFQGN